MSHRPMPIMIININICTLILKQCVMNKAQMFSLFATCNGASIRLLYIYSIRFYFIIYLVYHNG